MGTWGFALFADDDAADTRESYRCWLAETQSSEGATDVAMQEFGADFGRPGEHTAFWLALAVTEWKWGRLDRRVLDAALRIIDDGLDLAKWEQSPLRAKRSAVLKKTRAQLVSPAPPEKAMPKPLVVQLPGWEFSELVGYRMATGQCMVLHVLNYRAWSTLKVKAPVVTVTDWVGDRMPDEAEMKRLKYLNYNGLITGYHLLSLAMPPRKALREEQFVHLGCKLPVTRDEASSVIYGIGGAEGGTLDSVLKRVLAGPCLTATIETL